MGARETGLCLLLLGAAASPGPGSDSHSLRYFYTGVSEPRPGVPRFVAAGYVDDVPFIRYDSETQTALLQAPWMEGAVDGQYWETETRNLRTIQAMYRVSLRTLIQRYNRSGDLHTYQNMYGCTLLADGSTRGIDQFAFDGDDFISFDKDTLSWVAADTGGPGYQAEMGCLGQPSVSEAIPGADLRRVAEEVPAVREGDAAEERAPGCAGHQQRRPRRPQHPLLPGPRLLPPAHRPELAERRGEPGAGDMAGGRPAQRGRDLPRLGNGGDRPPGAGPLQLLGGAREPGPADGCRVGAPAPLSPGPRTDYGHCGRSPGCWDRRICSLQEVALRECWSRPLRDPAQEPASVNQQPGLYISLQGSDLGYESNSSLELVAGQQPVGGPGTGETHVPAATQPLLPARVSAPPDGVPPGASSRLESPLGSLPASAADGAALAGTLQVM